MLLWFFCLSRGVKLKPFKLVPVVVAFSVIAAVGLARWGEWEFFERLDRMTFDMRARQALGFAAPSATTWVLSSSTRTACARSGTGRWASVTG